MLPQEEELLEVVSRLPSGTGSAPVVEEVDINSVLQEDQPVTESVSMTTFRVDENTPLLQKVSAPLDGPETASVDTLTLQISDNEEINEQFEQNLLEQIDRMQQGIDDDHEQHGVEDVDVQIIIGSTASITAGVVSWVLRGGSLLASLMSTVPLLNRFDPLPIFKKRDDEEDDGDGDDNDSPEKEHAKRVDRMFSGKRVNPTKGESAND